MPVLYQHWKFSVSESYGAKTGEREIWYCKHCQRKLVIMSYLGKRNDNTLEKPCRCLSK